MASPQVENGHLRIANELYEALVKAPVSIREMRLFMAIIRQTYGFQRKVASISVTLFAEMTGLYRAHIPDALKSLERKNMIVRTVGGPHETGTYQVQKDYEKWCYQNSNTEVGVTELANPIAAQGDSQNGNTKSLCYQNSNTTVTEPVTQSNQISNTLCLLKDNLKDKLLKDTPLPPEGAETNGRAAREIVLYINSVAGRNFSTEKADIKEIVRAIRTDKATVDDCKLVVDFCYATYSPDYLKFLDTVSPFRAKNWSANLSKAREWNASGRKSRIAQQTFLPSSAPKSTPGFDYSKVGKEISNEVQRPTN